MTGKGTLTMPIELTCSCGKRLRVADDLAGRQGQCPFCGELLTIPEADDADKAIQVGLGATGLPWTKDSITTPDAVTLPPTAKESHQTEKEAPESDDNAQLTPVGCILALLTFAVIGVVAIPIVRWRDPDTGQPLPRSIAIVSPILIGAAVHGIGMLLLRLLGLRVWKKPEKDAEK
jgi:hypothetical protein